MDDHWCELIEFIIDKTALSRQKIERILDLYTPETLPQALREVIRDILTEKEVTKEGVNPFTQYGALSSLMDLETEHAKNEFLDLDALSEHGTSKAAAVDVSESFIEYSNLIEEICSETEENEETICRVHRAYLEYIYMKTNDPDTLIPFLKWYLKTEENINHDL